MQPGHDQTGDVRNVCHQHGADVASDLTHAGEIDETRIRARAHGDHFRALLARDFCELIVINLLIPLANAVMDNLEKSP
jgi:hypothetical protein